MTFFLFISILPCKILVLKFFYFPLIFQSLQTQESASEHMWGQFLSNMVPEITNVVKFCKRLPGKNDSHLNHTFMPPANKY